MRREYKILATLAVILFTALAIYRVEMNIPILDKINDPFDLKYKAYMLLREELLAIFVIGNTIVWVTGYRNVMINCCLIFNISLFGYLIFKNRFMIPEQHSYFDWSVLGAVIIYLVKLYWKDSLTLIKTIINEIYIKCPLPKKKRKAG